MRRDTVSGLTETSWEFGDYPIVKSMTTYSPCPQVRVFPLQYLEVSIEGNQCTALNDSGCQIPIVSNRLFGWCAEGAVGHVNLHGFGQDHVVQAPSVNLTVKLCDPASESECGDMLEIPLVCAVTDLGSLDYDVILPAAVESELQAPAVSAVLSDGSIINVDLVTRTADCSGQVEPGEADIVDVDDIPEDNIEGESSVLISKQKADPSLASYKKVAEVGRPGVVVHCGTLCQKDQVEGQPMSHACAPEGHRTSARSDECVDLCAAVSDDDADVDFGRVVTPANMVASGLPSTRIEAAKLEHLDT